MKHLKLLPEELISVASETFGYTPDELKGKSRKYPLVLVRHVVLDALYNRYINEVTLKDLASYCNRDHSTIIWAVKKVKNREFDVQLKHIYEIYHQKLIEKSVSNRRNMFIEKRHEEFTRIGQLTSRVMVLENQMKLLMDKMKISEFLILSSHSE